MDGQQLTTLGYRLEDLAHDLGSDRDPLRRALADHLLLVRQAIWSLRDDERLRSDPPEADAIEAVLGPGAELEILTADAKRLIAELQRCLEETHE